MAKISYHNFFRNITISRFFVMLILLLSESEQCSQNNFPESEQCSQNNFPITKTNPLKVTKYKKVWWIFRPKWGKIKICVIFFFFVIKNKNIYTHYKYT